MPLLDRNSLPDWSVARYWLNFVRDLMLIFSATDRFTALDARLQFAKFGFRFIKGHFSYAP
jgi:hypothetical protein